MNSARILLQLAALLGAPLLLLVALRVLVDDDLSGLTVNRSPVVVAVTEREVRDQQRVNVLLAWEPGPVARAPGWSGLVTATYLRAGDEARDGQRVLSVDGIDRLAFASSRPFFRPLAAGDRGDDVLELHRLLLSLGLIDSMPAGPEFASLATIHAVEELNRSLGAVGLDRFEPALLVWLPFAPFPVESTAVEVGAPAPAPGSVLLMGPARLTGARLEPQTAAEPIRLEPDVAYVLVKGELRMSFDAIALTVSAESLPELATLVGPTTARTDALVEREVPLRVLAVPATAITANAMGALCAWVQSEPGSDVEYRPVPVRLAGSQFGVTNVASGLSPGDRVLANPAETLADSRCP